MKLHSREELVRRAEASLRGHIAEFSERYSGLTSGEWGKVVVAVLSDELGRHFKYQIREERHPGEPDREGGLK